MQRSAQLQVLSWLTALATLGAATHPTFDTLLFAVVFVFSTLVLHVRERLFRPTSRSRVLVGQLAGLAIAWGAVALHAFTHLRFPPRMSVAMLIASAAVPTGILVVELVLAAWARACAPARSTRRAKPSED